MPPPPHFPCFFLLSLLLLLLLTPLTSSRPLRLRNDLRINSTDLSDVTHFLHKFGYLSNPDADLKSAISLYQSNHGLTVTGHLDPATLSQISTPRCGVSDKISVSRYAYFPGQPRWMKPTPITLTYALSPNNTINYIPQSEIKAAVRRAFDRWARVIPVNFLPAVDYEAADVKLGFYSGDHGDGEAFDGVLGVLAHAFSPESGRLHLDKAERWAVDFGVEAADVAVDLESVATHEIGHVLGLGHSAAREAVMYPSLRPRTKKVELSVDDVEGVQALYGSNPNFQMSSVLESDTSDADLVRGGFRGVLVVVMAVVMVCI